MTASSKSASSITEVIPDFFSGTAGDVLRERAKSGTSSALARNSFLANRLAPKSSNVIPVAVAEGGEGTTSGNKGSSFSRAGAVNDLFANVTGNNNEEEGAEMGKSTRGGAKLRKSTKSAHPNSSPTRVARFDDSVANHDMVAKYEMAQMLKEYLAKYHPGEGVQSVLERLTISVTAQTSMNFGPILASDTKGSNAWCIQKRSRPLTAAIIEAAEKQYDAEYGDEVSDEAIIAQIKGSLGDFSDLDDGKALVKLIVFAIACIFHSQSQKSLMDTFASPLSLVAPPSDTTKESLAAKFDGEAAFEMPEDIFSVIAQVDGSFVGPIAAILKLMKRHQAGAPLSIKVGQQPPVQRRRQPKKPVAGGDAPVSTSTVTQSRKRKSTTPRVKKARVDPVTTASDTSISREDAQHGYRTNVAVPKIARKAQKPEKRRRKNATPHDRMITEEEEDDDYHNNKDRDEEDDEDDVDDVDDDDDEDEDDDVDVDDDEDDFVDSEEFSGFSPAN